MSKSGSLTFLVLFTLFASNPIPQAYSSRELYQMMLDYHPYAQNVSPDELEEMPKQDRPDLAWQQNYLMTMDPQLNRPAPERLQAVYAYIDQVLANPIPQVPGTASNPWQERGPDNVGGRTRAIMWDPNSSSGTKVWAGGVTGGLWYNNNISNVNSPWVSVANTWDNLSITAIAYDPNNTNTFYVATGEGWGAGAARGAGIWKSTDGGVSWNQLSSTSSFYYINDLVVRNESGTSAIYAATRGNYYRGQWHGSASSGLQRSTNGGSSWTNVMPNVPGQSFKYAVADIEIAADNRLWVGTQLSPYGGSDRGGGRVLYSDNGTSWTVSHTVSSGERVEIACAPSNSNYVYALTEIGSAAGEIARTTNKGSTWTVRNEPADADLGIPNSDFTRGQAWYDLIMGVDPNNADIVYAGGIDLFRSTDGANSWSQISKWSNNNNLAALPCSYVHADQHAIIFKPGSSDTVLFGTDGGIFYTTSASTSANANVIAARNHEYNVTQFYATALHPTAGSNYALAGAQDNGTQKFSLAGFASTSQATGGDGAYCFIDQTNANYQITSYVYNSYWRSTNGGATWGSRFQTDYNTGRFINPADYDDNQDILYSARTSSTVNRVSGISSTPSIGSISISGMSSMASHLRVSPYTTSSTTLFIGTEGGDLYKVTNANGSPSTTNIGSASFPAGNVSCVELGANENEILVTFSNYGVNSVWYTSNGGTTWQSKEGNLPDMPVRWALFNPNDYNEVILATEAGIWSSTNFNNTSPTWGPSNSGLAKVRVDMLQYRSSDDVVIAATHGRGLFSSSFSTVSPLPVANFGLDPANACLGDTLSLVDSTLNFPNSWSWTISPTTFQFVNGTNANSQNPQIVLNANGQYSVTLIAANVNGSDTLSRANFISAGGLSLPYTQDFESSHDFSIDNPDNGITWGLYTVGGSSPGNQAMGINFFNYSATGNRDGLISPPLDFSGYSSVDLDFDYAYARYSASFRDSMAVYVSTDCGATFNRVASFSSDPGVNFATVADQSSSFSPSTSNDWCGNTLITNCPNIDLSAYAGNSEVLIKFEGINGYGNNLYIDNINVSGTSAGPIPSADFSANDSTVCTNASVSFTDLSTNSPSSWAWTVSPATHSFVGGTSASSQNPQIQFSAPGNYTISLSASNAFGSDTETKTGFIQVAANLSPSVTISGNASSWCAGSNAIFTVTPSNGGTAPIYQWKVNGINVGTNSPSYSSSSLANGDLVTVEMTSNENCLSSSTATSNSITVIINPTVVPSVSISANASSICAGDQVTFTASVTNGGTNPSYQWKLNGANVGSNSAVYVNSNLATNDQVWLEVLSNATCASANAVSSNTISMNVRPLPIITNTTSIPVANLCPGDSLILSANVNNHGISGSLSNWSGNGVQNNVFYASLAGAGSHNLSVSYAYTNSPNCSVSELITVNVDAIPQPTISYSNLVLTCNQAGFNYLWFLNGSPAPGVNNQQTYNVQSNGQYQVQLGTVSCFLFSDSLVVADVSIEELKAAWNWSLYPNPAHDQITVELDNPGVATIKIQVFDQSGRMVLRHEESMNAKKHRANLNVSDLAAGAYQIQARLGDLSFEDGFIILKD